MVAWTRKNAERRRVAFLRSQEQQRDGIAALARAGLHAVRLQTLDEAMFEIAPPAMYG